MNVATDRTKISFCSLFCAAGRRVFFFLLFFTSLVHVVRVALRDCLMLSKYLLLLPCLPACLPPASRAVVVD